MTKLEQAVREIVEEQEDIESYLQDLKNHGCISGMVSELIYYKDTEKWFDMYRSDIVTLLEEVKDSTGMDEKELFGDRWESLEDMYQYFESELYACNFEDEEDFAEAQIKEEADFYLSLNVFNSTSNKNLLAWFSFEETAFKLYE